MVFYHLLSVCLCVCVQSRAEQSGALNSMCLGIANQNVHYIQIHSAVEFHTNTAWSCISRIERRNWKVAGNRPEWQLVMESNIFKHDGTKTHLRTMETNHPIPFEKAISMGSIDKPFVPAIPCRRRLHHQHPERMDSPISYGPKENVSWTCLIFAFCCRPCMRFCYELPRIRFLTHTHTNIRRQQTTSVKSSTTHCTPYLGTVIVFEMMIFFILFLSRFFVLQLDISDNAWLIEVVRFEWQFSGDYQPISQHE